MSPGLTAVPGEALTPLNLCIISDPSVCTLVPEPDSFNLVHPLLARMSLQSLRPISLFHYSPLCCICQFIERNTSKVLRIGDLLARVYPAHEHQWFV